MFVDINLLPKKEPKNVVFLVSIAIVLLFAGAMAFVFYMSVQKTETTIHSLTQELKKIRALQAVQQEKLVNAQSLKEVQELEKTVKWAEQYPMKTVLLLRSMTKLLPERGFIMNFSYAENGTVSVTVQFDTSEEAAYYLKRLSDADFVADVQLKSLTTAEEKSDEEKDEENIEHILPRYIAQYELHVNKNALKEEKEKKQ
ncbi:PilN domain-containing protein [Thermaerobacillus caldiproteolyticus]|uniref:Type IV pilus assembly protein PilN n=1 Tax=Thermaerobacillus caldiproteolyticus TaxID=247480 RepID=A0A7V9Z420_9BACL|nr:fimbrial protein [Anoxybacillus caldiproteolyticus]MBA2873662.1 type IV pilus assembly protein PilN [Anoxybacillus caldiproteolyticus]